MLGPQFKDTYYEDESGTQKSFISGEAGKVTEVTGPVMAGRSLQGMLMHPATATGSKDDPMVSSEQRTAAIESGYKLDKENHARTHQQTTGKKVGARKLESDRQLSIQSIHGSGIPIQEMSDPVNPKVVTSSSTQDRTRAAGTYQPNSHRAWTQTDTRKQRHVTETEVPTAGAGEYLVNPKPLHGGDSFEGGHRLEGYFDSAGPWDPAENKPTPPNEDSYARHEQRMSAYNEQMEAHEKYQRDSEAGLNPVYPRKPPYKPVHPDEDYANASAHYDELLAMRESIGPENLFTKPAPPTNSKVYSEQVGSGYKYLNQGGDTDTQYFTRQPATEWETQQVTTFSNTHTAPESVMTHEIGHGRHMQGYTDPSSNRDYNRGADPLEESQADAYADIHSGYADRTAEAADPTQPTRNVDLSYGGYGSRSDVWSNDTERALYRVGRQASVESGTALAKDYKRQAMMEATGGESHLRDSTGGESHLAYINRGNTMALGRLMSENPDLASVFTHHPSEESVSPEKHLSRMSAAATAAQAAYESQRNKRLGVPNYEQLGLDV